MLSSIVLGARALWRRPLAALAMTLCLALGAAAASAAVTLFDAAVVRPFGLADAQRLVVMWELDLSRGIELSEVSLPDFEHWSRRSASFTSMAAFGSSHWPGLARMGQGSVPVSTRAVSRRFFTTLGAIPVRGRDFTEQDVASDTPTPVILSHRFWMTELGGAEDVVGAPLFIDGEEHRIIGVMGRRVSFPQSPDVWLPAERALQRFFQEGGLAPDQQRRLGVLEVLGRLRHDVSREQARDELAAISRGIHEGAAPGMGQWSVAVTPLSDVLLGDLGPRLWIAVAMAGAVLLFACGNAAAIRLAEIGGRELELTTRLFLGASRRRLASELAAESIALVALAGAVSIAVTAAVLAWTASIPVVADAGIVVEEHRVVTLVALALSAVLAWALAGWAPAVAGVARLSTSSLAASARSVGVGARSRAALVSVQVALAICLVAVAGGAWQAFDRLLRVDVGFATSGVTAIDITLPDWKYESASSAQQLQTALLSALEGVPGVEVAAGTSLRPFRFGAIVDGLPVKRAEDAATSPSDAVVASRVVATPRYFRVLGIRIAEGREFTEDDRAGSEAVAMVSRSLARALWGDASPLGRRVQSYSLSTKWQPRTVVGVADDVHSRGLERPALELYVPHTQTPATIGSYVIRTAPERTPTEAILRQALGRVEPELGLERIQTTGDIVGSVIAPARVLATTTGLLGVAGLALLALGVFGAAATALGAAWSEVAVRQAVGATPVRAARAPLARLTKAIGVGLVIGLIASPAAVGALVGSGAARDGVSLQPLLAGAILVIIASALAAWPSLARAAKAPPAELLRRQ